MAKFLQTKSALQRTCAIVGGYFQTGYFQTIGRKTLQRVILPMITGTIVPQKAINFLNPELFLNPLLQTTNTNPFTASCRQPAITAEPVNKFVKFAIKKKLNPVMPEIIIHFLITDLLKELLNLIPNSDSPLILYTQMTFLSSPK